jgi:anti-sigma factor RsiW
MFLEYVDNKLNAADRAVVETHLRSCAGCQARAEGFHAVSRVLSDWETPEISPWFNARLRQRIAEEEALTWNWRRALDWLRQPLTATAFAAMLVVASTAVWMARPAIAPAAPNPVPVQAKQHVDELMPVVDDFEMLANFDVITELKTPRPKSRL